MYTQWHGTWYNFLRWLFLFSCVPLSLSLSLCFASFAIWIVNEIFTRHLSIWFVWPFVLNRKTALQRWHRQQRWTGGVCGSSGDGCASIASLNYALFRRSHRNTWAAAEIEIYREKDMLSPTNSTKMRMQNFSHIYHGSTRITYEVWYRNANNSSYKYAERFQNQFCFDTKSTKLLQHQQQRLNAWKCSVCNWRNDIAVNRKQKCMHLLRNYNYYSSVSRTGTTLSIRAQCVDGTCALNV